MKVADTTRRALRLIEKHHREKDLFAGGFNVYSQLSGWCETALAFLGEFEEARAVLDKGLANAFEIDDRWGVGWMEWSYISVSIYKGDGENLIDHARKAIECFEETGIEICLGLAWSGLGMGYSLLGDYETARHHAEKGLQLQRETGVPVLLPMAYTVLAMIHSDARDVEKARECAEEALKLSREFKTALLEADALMVLGSAMGVADPENIAAAVQHIQQGLAMVEERKLRTLYAAGRLFLGELFVGRGLRKEALENLTQAESMWKEMGATGYWLTRTQEAMARLA